MRASAHAKSYKGLSVKSPKARGVHVVFVCLSCSQYF